MPPFEQQASPSAVSGWKPRQSGTLSVKWIGALAVLSVVSVVGISVEARQRYLHPSPSWFVDAERWYEKTLGALMWIVIGVASVMYLRARQRLAAAGVPWKPRPWARRTESRLVLYAFAVVLLLNIPIGFYKATTAGNDPRLANFDDLSRGPKVTVWRRVPTRMWLYPPFGCWLIYLDRRRVRETRRATFSAA